MIYNLIIWKIQYLIQIFCKPFVHSQLRRNQSQKSVNFCVPVKMYNQLIEIPQKDLCKLRDLYLKDWTENFLGYYTLDNFCRWFDIEPKLKNVKIYTLNGDWSDGTFIILDRYMMFLNSLSKSNDRLEKALSLLDWTRRYELTSFLDRHRPAVLNVIKAKNLKIDLDDMNLLYFLPKAEAIKINIEHRDDFVLKNLTAEDAEICDKLWPYTHQGSMNFMKQLTKLNLCVGAFTSQGELVSWCLRSQGPLSILQTKDEYKGKGLAGYIVRTMVNILAENNQDSYCFISETNKFSRRIFEKLNFRIMDKAYWIRVNWSKTDEFGNICTNKL